MDKKTTKAKDSVPCEDDLRTAAPHIQYEIDTYLWAWKLLQETPQFEIVHQRLIVEALLLHFRSLLNFFRPRRTMPTDVLARHFIPSDDELDKATEKLEIHRDRLNSLLSHLSYRREGYSKSDNMNWYIDEMTGDLANAWKRFLQLLSPGRREWFKSEHADEIPLVSSPLVTVRNPLAGGFTTTITETSSVSLNLGTGGKKRLGRKR